MNDFTVIFVAVMLGNAASILIATYLNTYTEMRNAKRRQKEFDEQLRRYEEAVAKEAKPVVVKRAASPSRTKKV